MVAQKTSRAHDGNSLFINQNQITDLTLPSHISTMVLPGRRTRTHIHKTALTDAFDGEVALHLAGLVVNDETRHIYNKNGGHNWMFDDHHIIFKAQTWKFKIILRVKWKKRLHDDLWFTSGPVERKSETLFDAFLYGNLTSFRSFIFRPVLVKFLFTKQ